MEGFGKSLAGAAGTALGAAGTLVETGALATQAVANSAKSAVQIADATAVVAGEVGTAAVKGAGTVAVSVTDAAVHSTKAALEVAKAGASAASKTGVATVGAAANIAVDTVETIEAASAAVNNLISGPLKMFNSWNDANQKRSNTTATAESKQLMIKSLAGFYSNEVNDTIGKLKKLITTRIGFAVKIKGDVMKELCSTSGFFVRTTTCDTDFKKTDKAFTMLKLKLNTAMASTTSSLQSIPGSIFTTLNSRLKDTNGPTEASHIFHEVIGEYSKQILAGWTEINAILDRMTALFSKLVEKLTNDALGESTESPTLVSPPTHPVQIGVTNPNNLPRVPTLQERLNAVKADPNNPFPTSSDPNSLEERLAALQKNSPNKLQQRLANLQSPQQFNPNTNMQNPNQTLPTPLLSQGGRRRTTRTKRHRLRKTRNSRPIRRNKTVHRKQRRTRRS